MSGRLLVDWIVDRLKSDGTLIPRGTRMGAYDKHADRAELRRLCKEHSRAWKAFPHASDDDRELLARAIVRAASQSLPDASPLAAQLVDVVSDLLKTEPSYQPFSLPDDISTLSPLQIGELVTDLRHRIRFLGDEEISKRAPVALWQVLAHLLDRLPDSAIEAADTDMPFLLVDAAALVDKPHELMSGILSHLLVNEAIDENSLFLPLRRQLYRNCLEASGVVIDPDIPLFANDTDKVVQATDCKDEPAIEVAERYFAHTAILDLLTLSVPFVIPDRVRFEHMHILAGTGHGKTQTLQHLIVSDLLRPADEVPSMVVLDSQGDMLDVLKRSMLFDPTEAGSLADRVLIVDPSDVYFAPALNLFDIQSERLEAYDLRDREQVLAGIIEIYDYIFGGLLGAELTQKQAMTFRFLAQLMLAIPGSTIHTLRELLEDASPYLDVIASLPDTARSFFENHFFAKSYQATREQILRRLYGVLQNPSFERMFAHPHNRLDLFDVLNEGGIVLVNTAKDFLKSEASSIFGRYIIALTLKAAMERATLPQEKRRPTFLWIDEASEYFDDNIDNLLIQARKFKLGLVMAHQYLGQLPRGLPASMMTNTSIKFAGGISDRDARSMAPEMRTTAEFLTGMTKASNHTHFAAHVRNVTPQALRLKIPFGTAETLATMQEDHYELLRAASRERLAARRQPTAKQDVVGESKASAPAAADSPERVDDIWEDF